MSGRGRMQLTKQIENMQNMYDLLALCCSYIFNEIENEPYDFAAFNDTLYIHVYDNIVKYNWDKENLGELGAFREFRDFVIRFMGENSTVEKCYAIVKYIDEKIEYEFRYDIVYRKDLMEYDSINEQCKDKVRVLLKNTKSFVDVGNEAYKHQTKDKFNLLRDSHDCPCSKLDAVTKRYMIWDEEVFRKYPFKIYRVKESHYINKHFENRNKVIFAVIPFTNESIKTILSEKRVNGAFYIEQMEPDTECRLKRKYELAYKGTLNKDVDFLVFPEMLMTDEIRADCSFNENGPVILINGSCSKNKVNRSVVCTRDGEELFSYCKKNPYIYEDAGKEYTEWLDAKENKEYSLLDIPNLGRVSVAICKDLWSEEIKMFHKMMKTNILIVPAFTPSGDLESSARCLSEEYNCIVVLANSCSALPVPQRDKKIGFVTLPAKRGSDRTTDVKYYKAGACQKECANICKGQLITIEFTDFQGKNSLCCYKTQIKKIN